MTITKRVVKIQLIVILFVYCFLITLRARQHENIFGLNAAFDLLYSIYFYNLIKAFMADILKCIMFVLHIFCLILILINSLKFFCCKLLFRKERKLFNKLQVYSVIEVMKNLVE